MSRIVPERTMTGNSQFRTQRKVFDLFLRGVFGGLCVLAPVFLIDFATHML